MPFDPSMFAQYLPFLAGQAQQPGLAQAFNPQAPAAGMAFNPTMPGLGSGQYGVDQTAQMVNGLAAPPPQADPSFQLPNPWGGNPPPMVGGPTGAGTAPGTGPILANEANVNKLAAAPIDPTKLAALMGLGQTGAKQGTNAPGVSPATGHGLTQGKGVATDQVKRPGALGIK